MTSRADNPEQDHGLPGDLGFDEAEKEISNLVFHYIEKLNDGVPLDEDKVLRSHPKLGPTVLTELRTYLGIGSNTGPELEPPIGTLGDYTLRRQIGRGGMGVVYEAWENSLDRRVALKVLPPGIAADARSSTRFLREAQIAAKLSHPQIVPVHATGIKDNTPWYAMEFVEGETLAQMLTSIKDAEAETETPFGKKGELAFYSNIASAFADVADGLQHAHSKGVTHRDIKPSNLILDSEGRLRILDFGLARLEGQESITISGDLVGTPLYMSPEQARQKKIRVDHRTDVYSLGATMYEAVCGRPPFKGKDHQDTLSQIIERDPVEPKKLNQRISKELETIVLKCLRKEPADRYGTAEALEQDLRRFIRGDPIEARPQTALERCVRKIGRHWRSLVVWAVIAILAALSTTLLWVVWLETDAARHRQFERQVLPQKLKLLRCRTTLEAATGRSRIVDSHGFFTFRDFEGLETDAALAEVIEELTDLTRRFPERFEAHYYLAHALCLSGRPEEARKSLERALDEEPGFPPAVVLEAELAGDKLVSDRLRESVEGLRRNDWKAVWLQAQLARSEGRPDEAVRAYGRLITLDSKGEMSPGFSVDLRLERGLARLEAGDYRRAAEDFIVARDQWPEFLEPALLLGKAYLLDGNAAWANDVFEELHHGASWPDEAARWIVILHLSLGDSFQALRWSRKVAEPAGQRWLSGWCLLTLFEAADEPRRRALETAQQALWLDPRDVDALLTTAFAKWWNRADRRAEKLEEKLDEVERICEEVIALDRENARAHGLLTRVSLVRGETARTLELAGELGALDGGDPLVNFLENYTLWVLGRNAELKAALERQTSAVPAKETETLYEKVSRLMYQADILAREGEHREAVTVYEKALEVDPGRSWVENFKCTRLFQLGEYEEAAECFAERAARGDSVYFRVFAQVLVTLGRPGDAVSAACEILEAEPGHGPARETLLRLVREYGDERLPSDVVGLIHSLEQASAAANANPHVLALLAFLRLHGSGVRDDDKAREAISRALKRKYRPDAEALVTLAEVRYAQGNIGEAVRRLEEALRSPGATQAHGRLLDRYRSDALPDLPSYASVDAALESLRPGEAGDLDLLRDFPREPRDAASERRLAYLQARVLARSGKCPEAIPRLVALADPLNEPEPEPHVQLSECLVASGKAEAAEIHLRRAILESGEARPELWYAWLDVCLSHLRWSPGNCLERLPGRGEDTLTSNIRWLLEELSEGRGVRIDCAGTEEYASSSGLLWGQDRFFRGGWAKNWSGTPWGRPTVKGSVDEWLYAMSRWFEGDAYQTGYAIPLPRGRYRVILHFCEGWAGAPGVRTFDVLIEEDKVFKDYYDGFARAGFGVATSESFDVEAEDGLLEIEFRAQKSWWASVAAIEVRPIP